MTREYCSYLGLKSNHTLHCIQHKIQKCHPILLPSFNSRQCSIHTFREITFLKASRIFIILMQTVFESSKVNINQLPAKIQSQNNSESRQMKKKKTPQGRHCTPALLAFIAPRPIAAEPRDSRPERSICAKNEAALAYTALRRLARNARRRDYFCKKSAASTRVNNSLARGPAIKSRADIFVRGADV